MKYSVLLPFLLISICNVSADGNVLVEKGDGFFLLDYSNEQKANNLEKAKATAEFAIGHFGSYAVNLYDGFFNLNDGEMVALKKKALAFIEEAIRLDPTNAGGLLGGKDVTGEEIIKANLILTNKNRRMDRAVLPPAILMKI